MTPSEVSLTLKLLGMAPKLYQGLQQWRRKPGKEERERVLRYCRWIDERRVFSAPFHAEVVESCIGSLNQVKEWTDEALSQVKHPGLRAAIGAILDQVRHFLDKWHGHRTPG